MSQLILNTWGKQMQKLIKAAGIKPDPEVDEYVSDPAYFIINDPDGNPIMFDQHV